MTPAWWAEAQQMACAGVSISEIARAVERDRASVIEAVDPERRERRRARKRERQRERYWSDALYRERVKEDARLQYRARVLA